MSGTVDTNRFLQWVEDCLVPTLGNFQLGERRSVVVMDNAPIHNDIRIINAIEAAGAIIIRCARVDLLLMCLLVFLPVLTTNLPKAPSFDIAPCEYKISCDPNIQLVNNKIHVVFRIFVHPTCSVLVFKS